MAHEWIKAPLALAYVSEGGLGQNAAFRICERAHSGLIAAKAERIVWNGQEEREKPIGKGFWWADGREALEQDWQAGDFSTWIERKTEVKAFGVSFDFVSLADLVPADRQADALRKISVIASDDWISAKQLRTLLFQQVGSLSAGAALLEACVLGQIGGRAMRAKGKVEVRGLHKTSDIEWAAIEWDIPLWFWRDFAGGAAWSHDWELGKAKGSAQKSVNFETIELRGIHFHRSGLINLGIDNAAQKSGMEPDAKRGRKPTYDWPKTSLAIFGQIHRGDFKPGNQAEIERALIAHLTVGDNAPSESTVRPYAKLIWEEHTKA